MRSPTANAVEFKAAVDALTNVGFTNARAIELLTKRDELRDRYAIGALTGLCSKYAMKDPGDQDTIVEMAFQLADRSLEERMK